MDFAVPLKIKESEKIDKYLDLAEQTVKHEGDSDTNFSWYTWIGPDGLVKQIRDQRKNRKHPDHSTVKIKENT